MIVLRPRRVEGEIWLCRRSFEWHTGLRRPCTVLYCTHPSSRIPSIAVSSGIVSCQDTVVHSPRRVRRSAMLCIEGPRPVQTKSRPRRRLNNWFVLEGVISLRLASRPSSDDHSRTSFRLGGIDMHHGIRVVIGGSELVLMAAASSERTVSAADGGSPLRFIVRPSSTAVHTIPEQAIAFPGGIREAMTVVPRVN